MSAADPVDWWYDHSPTLKANMEASQNNKHYTHSDIEWVPLGESGWKRASVTLNEGDSAFQPGSTKRVIWGPCIVNYEQAPDGGISANTEEIPST
jgi:hypothetical protein